MTSAHVARAICISLGVVAMFAIVAALLVTSSCGRGPGPCRPAIGAGDTGDSKRCEVRR